MLEKYEALHAMAERLLLITVAFVIAVDLYSYVGWRW